MSMSKLGKSAYSHIAVWYDSDDGSIHGSMPDVEGFHTTVDSGQHPELFEKLSDCLQQVGEQPPPTLNVVDDHRQQA